MGTEEGKKRGGAPAQKVWVVNETPDSNPRLAEHLSLLSDALRLDLQLVEQEMWLGGHDSDLLANGGIGDTAIVH